MRTSPNDQKKYQRLQLNNGLRVLLISDPNGDKSAAAMAVNVGHFHDPKHREGLAHFLEHMLFLGTEKYPLPGEYQRFISHHGGSHNAWTGTEYTNYFFDINNAYFEQALDRFAQFFIAPIFESELVEKERQSVHSEYQLKIKDDVRRIYQVQKETINPDHPFSQFSVGSSATLADSPNNLIRDDLINFYQSQYSADRMTLALISPLPLEQMLSLVTYFDPITKVKWQPLTMPPLLREQDQKCYIKIQPVKDIRKLKLSFQFDSMRKFYPTKPLSFLAHIIGDESPTSLIAYLRHLGLINAMTAGGGISGSNFKEFTLSFNLTEAGLDAIETIIETSFFYIRLIESKGIEAWRYHEKQSVIKRAFTYQEATRAIETVSHLTINMHEYPDEDIIYGDYAMEQFDPILIKEMTARLIPDNLRVTLVARNITADNHAKWYSTPYSVEPIPQQQLNQWKNPSPVDEITLPTANPFVSTALAEIFNEQDCDRPEILTENSGFRLWFKQASEFNLPKGHIYVSVDSQYTVASVRNIACCRLVVELLLDHLSQITYQAEIAGMHYNIYAHQGGYTIHISGFSDKQILLLEMILSNRLFGHFDPKRFKIIKAQLQRHYRNQGTIKPISQLFNQMSALLQPNNPSPEALNKVLEPITLEDIPDFITHLYEKIHIEILAYGNWPREQIATLGEYIDHELAPNSKPAEETARKLISIDKQRTLEYYFPCEHNDSALLMYFQSPNSTPEQIALFTLCNHLMSSTFFHELRTKQQLGYVVGSGNLPLNRHAGLIFYVQSPYISPMALLDSIDEFLNDFPILTFELSHQQWETSKLGLISQILEPDNNMKTQAKRYWSSIGNKDYQFDQRQRIAQALQNLSRADTVRFMMTLKAKHRDRMVVYSLGLEHHGSDTLAIGESVKSATIFHDNNSSYQYR